MYEECGIPDDGAHCQFAGTCEALTLLRSENIPYRLRSKVSARYATSKSVIFDMFSVMPDLEEPRLSDKISEVFLEVIKEEPLIPKLSRIFIVGTKGIRVPLKLDGIARR